MNYHRLIIVVCSLLVFLQASHAQKFTLFAPEVKTEYPSVVYNFLETYLYKIDEMERKGESTEGVLRDDKVIFLTGTASTARDITTDMRFELKAIENKYYEASWSDSSDKTMLSLAFPMQYELLLGKPKVEIEKEFNSLLSACQGYTPIDISTIGLSPQADGSLMTAAVSNYYIESLNSASYYRVSESGDTIPIFSANEKWHSAANLFHGCIEDISNYTLYIEQHLYGFKKMQYTVTLQQWIAYCQAMKLNTYFAVEEEREDGLKALLIAESPELGFNHMVSLTIPTNFVSNKQAVFKATLNAYIPTHNVKDLYQEYVQKPKKQI